MAFDPESMGVLSYCNGFTVWFYRSETDSYANIIASDYFTPFYEYLGKGDVIFFTEFNGRTGRRRIDQLTETLVTVTQLV